MTSLFILFHFVCNIPIFRFPSPPSTFSLMRRFVRALRNILTGLLILKSMPTVSLSVDLMLPRNLMKRVSSVPLLVWNK